MATRECVQQLVALVEQGREVEAINRFYAVHAQTQENTSAPTVGREALAAKEQQFLDSLQAMHARKALAVLVDGDRAAINWLFEWTNGQGARFRMIEVALQRWENDQIVFERYFYDTATLHMK